MKPPRNRPQNARLAFFFSDFLLYFGAQLQKGQNKGKIPIFPSDFPELFQKCNKHFLFVNTITTLKKAYLTPN